MFNNLKLGSRLALGFGALLLLLCVSAGIGAYQTSRINSNVDDLTENWLPSVKTLAELRSQANSARRLSLRHLLEETKAGKDGQGAIRDKIIDTTLPTTLAAYEKLVSSPEEAALFQKIKAQWATYKDEDRKLIAMSNAGAERFDEARRLAAGATSTAFTDVLATIEQSVQLNMKGSADSGDAAAATYRSALIINACAVVAALLAGVTLAVAITRSITRPLQRAVQVATAVAAGDLSSTVEVKGRDETAQLLQALSDMNGSLARIVGQVRNSSENIATGSSQIASGNQDLSQRTEEQASNLQQTAASMEEIAGTVRLNADTANQASSLASQASAAALKGGEVVGAVVTTMDDISAASKRIVDIIGVIDGIAFQTNILALNAAVEAARAGEQGRGFAVVAGEVRSLAGRSADAAKEIKALISASVEKVEIGARQVNAAGSSMDEIVTQVRRVTQLIAEIANATTEQAKGISQVGDAVTQLDEVTQQNAALVEESAAAADSLQHQAAALAEAVRVFKLSGGSEPMADRPAKAPATPTAAAKHKSPAPAPVKPRPAAAPKPPANAVLATAGADSWETF